MNAFTLQIDRKLQRQLLTYRSTVRNSIKRQLNAIVSNLNSRPSGPEGALAKTASIGPPFRFYVWEGVRVLYKVTRSPDSVVVLELRSEEAV